MTQADLSAVLGATCAPVGPSVGGTWDRWVGLGAALEGEDLTPLGIVRVDICQGLDG